MKKGKKKNKIKTVVGKGKRQQHVAKVLAAAKPKPKNEKATKYAKIVSLSKNYAFAQPLEGGEDIFIPGSGLCGAFLGDTVLVGDLREEERGPAGRVWRVTESVPAETTGTVVHNDYGWFVIPDSAIRYDLKTSRYDLHGAEDGDKVLVSLEQDNRGTWLYATVKKVFGKAENARVCADAIIERYGIPSVFPNEVLVEAEASGAAEITEAELASRLDLRTEKIFTIDGADAKDLDDAISVKRTRTGYILGVHIADVSHYVRENTALDREAERRGTSVYFADRVIPMLPEALSNGACSLNAGTDKLAFSAIIHFDKAGRMVKYDFKKSVINSKVRGVYSEVNAVFDGSASKEVKAKYRPVLTQLMAAKELAEILQANSSARGTMELESGESRFVLDENGVCVDIMPRSTGAAEQLIEQMMISANIAAARFSKEHKLPFLYRVHGSPDPKKVEELVRLLKLVNIPCGELERGEPKTEDFAVILERAKGSPAETLVSQRLLRTMEKARYSEKETGHFGLALMDYSHFTSPIRRYPDTAIHRILTAYCSGEGSGELERRFGGFVRSAAKSTSETEVRAMMAERDAEDCYMAEFMSRHIGERFSGVVSGVTQHGVFVRLENSVEGFVALEQFPGETFTFDGLITHRSAKRTLTVGTPMQIIVASARVATGKVDFAPDFTEEQP